MAKRPPRPRDPNQLVKLIVDISTGERLNDSAIVLRPDTPATEARRKGGLKGGKARARRRIAERAAQARWRA